MATAGSHGWNVKPSEEFRRQRERLSKEALEAVDSALLGLSMDPWHLGHTLKLPADPRSNVWVWVVRQKEDVYKVFFRVDPDHRMVTVLTLQKSGFAGELRDAITSGGRSVLFYKARPP